MTNNFPQCLALPQLYARIQITQSAVDRARRQLRRLSLLFLVARSGDPKWRWTKSIDIPGVRSLDHGILISMSARVQFSGFLAALLKHSHLNDFYLRLFPITASLLLHLVHSSARTLTRLAIILDCVTELVPLYMLSDLVSLQNLQLTLAFNFHNTPPLVWPKFTDIPPLNLLGVQNFSFTWLSSNLNCDISNSSGWEWISHSHFGSACALDLGMTSSDTSFDLQILNRLFQNHSQSAHVKLERFNENTKLDLEHSTLLSSRPQKITFGRHIPPGRWFKDLTPPVSLVFDPRLGEAHFKDLKRLTSIFRALARLGPNASVMNIPEPSIHIQVDSIIWMYDEEYRHWNAEESEESGDDDQGGFPNKYEREMASAIWVCMGYARDLKRWGVATIADANEVIWPPHE
jgi:hypothetical protein